MGHTHLGPRLKIHFIISLYSLTLIPQTYELTHTYTHSHPQAALFLSIRTLQCGETGLIPEYGIETWLTETPLLDSTTQPRRKYKRLCITFVFVYIYPLNGSRELDSFEEPCITLVATITSLAKELNPTGVGEHIYIYCHPQTVSFYQNSSMWLDTQDARSRDRNPSNFTLD